MDKTIGAQLEIKKILVHNKNKKREGVDETLLTDDWKEIIEDDEIQIVIEVIGGIEPAKTMILEALKAGKNVVSANKDLIAVHGKELLDAAEFLTRHRQGEKIFCLRRQWQVVFRSSDH